MSAHALRFGADFESFVRSMCYAIDSRRFFYRITLKNFVHPLDIFFFKTLEIGKCLQRQQNALVLNASPIFRRKFCWIVTSSAWARVITRMTDVAFRYLALKKNIFTRIFALKNR